MPIFNINGKKVLFIHIPKTGGSSVNVWLSSLGETSFYETSVPSFMKCSPQHMSFEDIKLLQPNIEFDFIFSIVRDPYTRIESEYAFRTDTQFKKFKRRPSFSNWLNNSVKAYNKNSYHFDNHMRPQNYFLGNFLNTYKLETGLENIIEIVSKELSIDMPKEIPKFNTSNRAQLNPKWSYENYDLFHKLYSSDFEILKYERRNFHL